MMTIAIENKKKNKWRQTSGSLKSVRVKSPTCCNGSNVHGRTRNEPTRPETSRETCRNRRHQEQEVQKARSCLSGDQEWFIGSDEVPPTDRRLPLVGKHVQPHPRRSLHLGAELKKQRVLSSRRPDVQEEGRIIQPAGMIHTPSTVVAAPLAPDRRLVIANRQLFEEDGARGL
eukprot:764413-Hanusia_phi.AAC.2